MPPTALGRGTGATWHARTASGAQELEYFTVVAGDLADEHLVVGRMRAARGRAGSQRIEPGAYVAASG